MAWFKMMQISGASYWDPNSRLPNALGGSVPTDGSLSIGALIFFGVGIFQGIVINEVIVRLIAFWGMYLLLKKHVIKEGPLLVQVGTSICFALLPFFPLIFLTVAGQPLLFYAFCNIWKRDKTIVSWIIICLFPFYSNFILSGFAVLLVLAAFFIWNVVRSRQIHLQFLLALAAFTFLSLVSLYKLIFLMIFDSSYVSHRTQIVSRAYEFSEAFRAAWESFRFGQYHAASLHDTFIVGAVLVAVIVLLIEKSVDKKIISFLCLCAAISLFYGFWKFIKPGLPDSIFIKGFQWDRVHFLHPLLWHLLFALSLSRLAISKKIPKNVALILVVSLICGQGTYAYLQSNHRMERQRSNISFAEFYSEPLFAQIREFINKPQSSYRVGSIGLHPAIALYNGFYTVDGYFANYPLEYKIKFRKIIEKELDKNQKIASYFDNWGSRCYLFTNEIGTFSLTTKKSKKNIRNLQFNTDQFYQLGGQYLFSAVQIANAHQNSLQLLKVFEEREMPWRIWLYGVNIRE